MALKVPEGQDDGYTEEGAVEAQISSPVEPTPEPLPPDLPDIPGETVPEEPPLPYDLLIPEDEQSRLDAYFSSPDYESEREGRRLDEFVERLSPGAKWRASVFDGMAWANPEKAARLMRIAEDAGVSVDLAERDPVFTQNRITVKKLPDSVSETLERNLSDPKKAAVLWESLTELDAAERAIRQYRTLVGEVEERDRERGPLNATSLERLGILWDVSKAQTEVADLGARAALSRFGLADPLTDEEQTQYKDALKRASVNAGEISGFAGYLAPAVQSADQTLEVLGSAVEYGVGAFAAAASATALAGAALNTLGPAGTAVDVGAATGAGLAAARIAAPLGAAKRSMELEIGMARAQYAQLRVDGKPLDPEVVDLAAVVGGALAGSIDVIPGYIFSELAIGAASKLGAKYALRNVIRDALKDATGREIIKRYAKEYVKLVAAEGVTEGVQDWIVGLWGELAKLRTSERRDGEYTSGDVLNSVFSGEALAGFLHSAAQGSQAASVFALPGVSVSAAIEYAPLEQRSAEGQEVIDKVISAASSARASRYAPEQVKRYLNEVSEDTGKKVYIDPDAVEGLATELKQAGKDESSVPWLAGLKDKAQVAKEAGRDVELGYGDLVEIVSTPEGGSFRAHVRPDISAPSQAEVEKYLVETESRVSSEIARAARRVEVLEDAKKVYEDHLAELKDSGYVVDDVAKRLARIVPAWIAVKAEQLKVSPKEIAEKLNLKVEGPMFSRDPRAVKLGDEFFTDEAEAIIRDALKKDDITDGLNNLARSMPELIRKRKKDGREVLELDRRFARGWLREKIYRQRPKTNQSGQRGSFDPNTLTVNIEHAADLSTFVHEAAHFILEAESRLGSGRMRPLVGLEQKIAELTGMPASRIYRVVAGAVDDVDAYRAVHEFFATEFERYLSEGKAPEASLRDVFRASKQWMLYVYKDTPEFLGDGVSPEMREVFDRLLAIDAAVQEQSIMGRYRSMAGEEAGKPVARKKKRAEAKQAEEDALMDEARGDPELADLIREERAKERLLRRWYKQIKKQKTAEWRQRRAFIMDRLIPQLKEQKPRKLRESMREPNGVKLDRKAVKEILGVKRIPASMRNMTVEKDGMLPDDLAEIVALPGIDSGEQLVRMLAEMKDVEKEAFDLAEQELKDILGDLLDPENLRREAEQMVKLENSEKVLQEFIRLNREAGRRGADVQAIKSAAREQINELRVKDLHPKAYHDAEIRAARLQVFAEIQGDVEEAARQAEIRLINYYLWKYATEQKSRVKEARKELRKLRNKKNKDAIIKAGEGYWERISVMLARMGLIPQDEAKGGIIAFNEWLGDRLGAAIKPPEVLREDKITPFDELTVGEALAAYDSIVSLRHMARNTNNIRLAEETLDFERTVGELVKAIRAARGDRDKSPVMTDSGDRSLLSVIREWRAKATAIPWLLIRLQGFRRVGPVTRVFDAPLNSATRRKHELQEQTVLKIAEVLSNMPKEKRRRLNRKYLMKSMALLRGFKDVPGEATRSTQLTGWQLLVALLNFGTQSGLQKFLQGHGMLAKGEKATTDHPFVQEVLSILEPEDVEIVKLVWEQFDKLFPELQRTYMEDKGVRLRKEEGIEIKSDKHGAIKGMYYPVVYDRDAMPATPTDVDTPEQTVSVEKIEAEVDGMFSWPGFTDIAVRPSAVHERKENYAAPIVLDFQRGVAAMEEVIHYVTHYQAIKGLYRIAKDPRVEVEITKAEGREHYKELLTWIREVAGERQYDSDPIERFFNGIRYGAVLSILGGSITTLFNQPLGVVNSVGELGGNSKSRGYRKLAQAIAQLVKRRGDLTKEALEQSQVLKHRLQTADRERKHSIEVARGKRGTLAKYNVLLMSTIGYIQRLTVDYPTWIAARDSFIEESLGRGEKMSDQLQRDAIDYADSVINRVQGSGEQKDLPYFLRSQRHAVTKMVTMFMTFFMAMANTVQDSVVGYSRGAYSLPEAMQRLFYSLVAPTIVAVLVKLGYNAAVDDDDEEEQEFWKQFVREEARYLIAGIPLGNMAFSMMNYDSTGSAPLEILKKGVQSYGTLLESAFGEESMTYYDWKNISAATSMMFRVAGGVQLARTGTGIAQSFEEGGDFAEIMDRVLFGAQK